LGAAAIVASAGLTLMPKVAGAAAFDNEQVIPENRRTG
jgi:hypothetical protein